MSASNIKKGQITAFIALGIVFLIAVSVFLFFSKGDKISLQNQEHQEQTQDLVIDNIVSVCLRNSAKDSLYESALHGGYFLLPANSLEDSDFELPYYFNENASIVPTLDELNLQIAGFISSKMGDCLQDSFSKVDENLLLSSYNVSAAFSSEKLAFSLFDIKDSYGKKYKAYDGNIDDLGFLRLYNAAKEYAAEQEKTPQKICMSCMDEISSKYDVQFHLERQDNSTVIFSLYDSNMTENGLQFVFAENFAGVAKEQNENQ